MLGGMDVEGGRRIEPPSSRYGSGGNLLTFSIERILAPDFGPKGDFKQTGNLRYFGYSLPAVTSEKLPVKNFEKSLLREQSNGIHIEESELKLPGFEFHNLFNFKPYTIHDDRFIANESFLKSNPIKAWEYLRNYCSFDQKDLTKLSSKIDRSSHTNVPKDIANSFKFPSSDISYNKCSYSPNEKSNLSPMVLDEASLKSNSDTKCEKDYLLTDCSLSPALNLRKLGKEAPNWPRAISPKDDSISDDIYVKLHQTTAKYSPVDSKTLKLTPCKTPELKPSYHYTDYFDQSSSQSSSEENKSELMKLELKLRHSFNDTCDTRGSTVISDSNRCSPRSNSCSSFKSSPPAVRENHLRQCNLEKTPPIEQLNAAVNGKSIKSAQTSQSSNNSSVNCVSSSSSEKTINIEEPKLPSNETTIPSDSSAIAGKEIDLDNEEAWPVWVFATRYSCRPSSGPRCRRLKKKERNDEKRCRTAFSGGQLLRLKQEFLENPYLSEKRRASLAQDLKLTESQVKIWFQNHRAKQKRASGRKNPLALKLMAHGLYNHSTVK